VKARAFCNIVVHSFDAAHGMTPSDARKTPSNPNSAPLRPVSKSPRDTTNRAAPGSNAQVEEL